MPDRNMPPPPLSKTLTYAALLEMSNTSSSQQAAIQTLTQSIAMMDAVEGKDAKLLQRSLRLIIPHIVESAMILGYVPWRKNSDGLPDVAPPGTVLLSWKQNATRGKWVPKAAATAQNLKGTRGWHLDILDPPYSPMSGSIFMDEILPAWKLMSPCVRSYAAAARQQLIEHQWLNRDRFNSTPGAFTFVRKDLGNADGKMRPWFRDVNAGLSSNLHASSADADNASDFRQLISKRAETIRELSAQTARERDSYARNAAIRTASTPQGRAEAAYGPIQTEHNEFAVSDGKEISAAPTLLSTSDGHMHFARARQTVLVLCGVPPQAIGESVNSERNASNHRQYEVAMGLFHASLRRMRQLINTILTACEIDAKFVGTTAIHTLETLAPLLKPEALHRKLSEVHNIPMAEFDRSSIEKWQASLLQPDAKRKQPTSDDPTAEPTEQRDSELEKKRAKRNKVEPAN